MIALPTPSPADLAADALSEPFAASADGPPRFTAASRLPRQERRDGLRVLAGTLATFALSSVFEAQERLATFAARFERWQVDELPLTLVALSLGLAWYAWRRRGETARLLAHNRELAQGLLDVQERERRELARELHDELAQHCTAIRVESAWLQACADPAQVAAAARRTADSAGLMQQAVRRLLRRLRPAELANSAWPRRSKRSRFPGRPAATCAVWSTSKVRRTTSTTPSRPLSTASPRRRSRTWCGTPPRRGSRSACRSARSDSRCASPTTAAASTRAASAAGSACSARRSGQRRSAARCGSIRGRGGGGTVLRLVVPARGAASP